ncbi:MAG: DUF932 domain-containing protein [Bacteroidales bacterium]|nr:DUF932 domain-containing protein [Bacteroidales bacterium]
MEQSTFNEKFFDFEKSRVQNCTLAQLERTHKENDVYGKPLRGIYHFALLQSIISLCAEQGLNANVWDLFAAQNKDRNQPGVVLLPQVEAQYGERAVEAHILRRVFANIRLTDFDTDEHTANLAVAFHQQGIQVGFGNSVIICHNQCMLSPTQYVATYGERGQGRGHGATIPQVLDTVKAWLYDAQHSIEGERKRIERMKEIDVDADTCFRLIGMLTAMRVKNDTTIKQIKAPTVYPLNQAQISRFTELLMMRYATAGRISVWDVYNSATELYKADAMDIPSLLPQNRAMTKFMFEQFPAIATI